MIQQGALDAIAAGVHGVHISYCGQVYEGTGVVIQGGETWVTTRCFSRADGPWIRANGEAIALVRTYDEGEE